MNKPKILVTRQLPIPAMQVLTNHFEVTVNSENKIMSKASIQRLIVDQDALLCLLTDQIDSDIIDAAKKLKVISNFAVGFNNIDVNHAQKKGIKVCITPGVLTEATADLTWALILACTRHIVRADQFTRNKQFIGWDPSLFLGLELSGKTLGILGMGRIGQAVAKRALAFNMKVIYNSRSNKFLEQAHFVDFETLLKESDILSIHAPYSPDLKHLFCNTTFNQMKKEAYLINTARGPIVDEAHLVDALEKNGIAGAGLDVYEFEPKIHPELLNLESVVLLPHIGSATQDTREKMALMAVENAIGVLFNQKIHAIASP
ncbi:MAG: 2-hydroxyacid dehydrogenase [Gammaproteobacteria bacterium]